MCIGGPPQNITLEDKKAIELCKEYEHLEIKITQKKTLDKAIKDRNRQDRRAISLMNGIL